METWQLTPEEATWPTLSGAILPGGYEVGEFVASDERMCRFQVRVLASTSPHAHLDLFRMFSAEIDSQIGEWLKQRNLRHPNITVPLAAGSLDHEDRRLAYVITEQPDETLAGVLRDRAITPDEAAEIVRTVCPALAYLHSNGRTHGHLAPEELLAFGDAIRISTEYSVERNAALAPALTKPKYISPEANVGNVTPAADVWCLAATLFEALTRKPYTHEMAGEVTTLPAPFGKVLASALQADPQSRCSLGELQVLRLNEHQAAAPVAAVPNAVITHVAAEEPSRPAERFTRVHDDDAKQSGLPKWWLAAAAVLALVVVLLLWAGRSRHNHVAATVPLAQTVAPAASARDNGPPPSSTRTEPAKHAGALAPEPETRRDEETGRAPETRVVERPLASAPAARSKPTVADEPVWRVVVFTYNRQSDAEKKANSLNERHHGLDAQVFSPSGGGTPYLVTIGGRMTREQAARLRSRVIGMGLPRDSYIQNYKS